MELANTEDILIETKFQLRKLFDDGHSHIIIDHNAPLKVQLLPKVAMCFKFNLVEYTSPIIVTIKYLGVKVKDLK